MLKPKGCDELGGHQLDSVIVALELPGQVVRTGAGFHAYQARGQVGNHFQQLAANHLGLDKIRLASLVRVMQNEYILGVINASDNTHGLPLSNK